MLLITYVTYATSHNNSTPDPTPTPTQLKPIPFTDEYFIWTTYGDQLTVVDFKSGVDLSDYDTLSIPATWIDNGIEYRVIAIGNYAFYSNFELGSSIINLDLVNATNLQFINDYAFENCDSFTGSLTIPNSVNYIYDCAFEGCSGFNGTLTIGNSVINVGNRAFSRARFTNVINNSPNFNLADNVGSARVLINATSGTSLDYENGSVVGCIAFGQLTIPSSVTRIYRDLFCYCSGFIGTLTIPDSVTTIDDGAFERCNGFTSLTIGNSVTSIGDYAFYNCSGFTGSLTIPNSVTSINNYAFYNCSAFNGTLTINDSVINIGGNAFNGCSKFNTIDVSNWTNIPTIGTNSFRNFNSQGGTVLVPENYDQLGISLSIFDGLPSTWQLQVI